MAMIHDAFANEKNGVTCEERSLFQAMRDWSDIVVRRSLNPGSSNSRSSSSCCGNNSSRSGSGSGGGSRSRSRSRSSEYE